MNKKHKIDHAISMFCNNPIIAPDKSQTLWDMGVYNNDHRLYMLKLV